MPNLAEVENLVRAELPALTFRSTDRGLSIFAGEREIAWQRPLSKKDMTHLADRAPLGEVLAIHVDSVETKNAWIAAEPNSCFDSLHFANYPAVLVDLHRCDLQVVIELLSEHLD